MSNLKGPEGDLPGREELANLIGSLDAHFRGVFNGNRKPDELLHPEQPNSSPSRPFTGSNPLEQQLLLDRALAGYRDNFFEGLNDVNLRALLKDYGERWVANNIRDYFERTRSTEMRDLVGNRVPASIVNKVGEIELKDMYAYSKKQQDFYQGQAGRVAHGTPEYREVRKQSDYWTVLTDILGPASDPEK